jgi:excisionase family DNA binding protein
MYFLIYINKSNEHFNDKYYDGGSMKNKYLTVIEASQFLRLARSTIYEYVYNRRIPFIKVEGKLVFDQDSLTTWMTSHERKEVSRKG